MITAEQLAKLGIDEKWLDPLNNTFEKFEMNTPKRMAAFIGQCQHESGNFKALEENLNYSKEGLNKVWPSRFPSIAAAEPYHRQPEKIANKVYADRMGNGNEASGEGFAYRGRGLIQLTGKSNYSLFSDAVGNPEIMSNPSLVATPEYAALSAGWFFDKNKLNLLADAGDYTTLTKRINGGVLGLQDRINHINKALQVLS
jgi:putative chitinase